MRSVSFFISGKYTDFLVLTQAVSTSMHNKIIVLVGMNKVFGGVLLSTIKFTFYELLIQANQIAIQDSSEHIWII